jgi:hypothetical protein
MSAPAPCYEGLERDHAGEGIERTIVSPRKYFCSGPSPLGLFWSAIYLYALKAPGSTVMYPNTDSLQRKVRDGWHEIRKNSDIQRFVEDVGHLVLKILGSHCNDKHRVKKGGDLHERNGRRTKRINEFLPVFAFEGDDFTASATDIRVDIKRFPEMINRAWTRHCTNIEQDADIGLEDGAKGVEEPTMGVDLLLIFLL